MEKVNKTIELLPVHVHDTRAESGAAAAAEAAGIIRDAIARNGCANVIFAAAPSQNDLLESLLQQDIDWSKVRGFHQDEYIGLPAEHPAGFGNFLRRAIFERVPFLELHYMACKPEDAEAMCEQYSALLEKYPPDLIFLGVGENGHLAFNDPAVADFHDPKRVKIVDLEVPHRALTLTMSQILSVPRAVAVVPTVRKAAAIAAALKGPISESCPASILRRCQGASLYLDADSASQAF